VHEPGAGAPEEAAPAAVDTASRNAASIMASSSASLMSVSSLLHTVRATAVHVSVVRHDCASDASCTKNCTHSSAAAESAVDGSLPARSCCRLQA
jgi:hypothetical protein